MLAAESKAGARSLPVVNVEKVTRSAAQASLVLPGNIQAVTEAPVLARASGYLKRLVDIGDRVKQGQLLAEIEAPELDQQIRQAQAALEQANSAVEQADAALSRAQQRESGARDRRSVSRTCSRRAWCRARTTTTTRPNGRPSRPTWRRSRKPSARPAATPARLQANLDRLTS